MADINTLRNFYMRRKYGSTSPDVDTIASSVPDSNELNSNDSKCYHELSSTTAVEFNTHDSHLDLNVDSEPTTDLSGDELCGMVMESFHNQFCANHRAANASTPMDYKVHRWDLLESIAAMPIDLVDLYASLTNVPTTVLDFINDYVGVPMPINVSDFVDCVSDCVDYVTDHYGSMVLDTSIATFINEFGNSTINGPAMVMSMHNHKTTIIKSKTIIKCVLENKHNKTNPNKKSTTQPIVIPQSKWATIKTIKSKMFDMLGCITKTKPNYYQHTILKTTKPHSKSFGSLMKTKCANPFGGFIGSWGKRLASC